MRLSRDDVSAVRLKPLIFSVTVLVTVFSFSDGFRLVGGLEPSSLEFDLLNRLSLDDVKAVRRRPRIEPSLLLDDGALDLLGAGDLKISSLDDDLFRFKLSTEVDIHDCMESFPSKSTSMSSGGGGSMRLPDRVIISLREGSIVIISGPGLATASSGRFFRIDFLGISEEELTFLRVPYPPECNDASSTLERRLGSVSVSLEAKSLSPIRTHDPSFSDTDRRTGV